MATRSMPIHGVFASIITPFAADGSIAWSELQEETALLSRSPVHGLCVGGMLGETVGSTPEEMCRLCEGVHGRTEKPIVAMVYPDSQPEALDLVRAVTSGGAQAVLVAQPHYLCQPDLRGLVEMFAALREEIAIPILLANCQKTAMVDLSGMQELIAQEVIDGVLLAGDAVHLMADLLCLHPRVPVFSGMEDLHYVGLLLGTQGIISDLAALFPGEMVDLYSAFREGGYDDARLRHERLVRLWRAFDHPFEQRARIRAALAGQGRKVGAPRSPYNLATFDPNGEVRAALSREGF
jgi:dihydrodipicolinate synthase/N-acetylneuraminate lyase